MNHETIETIIQQVIQLLAADDNISEEMARERFYLSDIFEKLNDIETGLYQQEPAYIYELLKEEEITRLMQYIF